MRRLARSGAAGSLRRGSAAGVVFRRGTCVFDWLSGFQDDRLGSMLLLLRYWHGISAGQRVCVPGSRVRPREHALRSWHLLCQKEAHEKKALSSSLSLVFHLSLRMILKQQEAPALNQ